MDEFLKLDPYMRCFALVGQFLHAWATMEQALHSAIGSAMGIELQKLQILVANIGFRDKINILHTLVNVSPNLTKDIKDQCKKEFTDLAGYSGNRNTIVHNFFQPSSSSDGVEFHKIQAKGPFSTPVIDWSVPKVQNEIATINNYRSFIETISRQFQIHPLPPISYIDPLFAQPHWHVPMRMQPSQAFWDYLSRQAEAPPSTQAPNPEEGPQTPQEPEE